MKTAIYLILILAFSFAAFTTVVASTQVFKASPSELPKLTDLDVLKSGDPIGGGGGGGGAPELNATFVGSNLIYS